MRNTLAAASVTLLHVGLLPAQTPSLSPSVREFVSVDAPVIALTHVKVIDGTGAPPADDQTVVIQSGKIQAIGSSARVQAPAGARVMDLRGHTVIPGLVGMHNHTFYTTLSRTAQLGFSAPRLYLASGVTTIRATGSYAPYNDLNLKRAIDQGEAPGPRMHTTGPYITGPAPDPVVWPELIRVMHPVPTPEDARRVVAYWAEEGVTWFKAYTQITRAALGAAIDEAHKRGLKVTAHLCSVSFREAAALGIDNLEHGLLTNTDYQPDKPPDLCRAWPGPEIVPLDLESEPVRATFREMIARNVAMTSTLPVFELFVANRPPLEQRVLDAMAPDVRTEYLAARAALTAPGAFAIPEALLKKAMAFEVAFVKAGGLLAAGVDPTGNGGALPGFGDQRNFELLIEAGFTPVQVVQIMTANGAKILGESARLGTVTAGKVADLVVIQGDPAMNPADIRKVTTVFKDGVGYDSAKLIASVRGVVGVR